jgi:hypothetical protein
MNRLLAGGLVAGFAGAATLALVAPVSAQSPGDLIQLGATLDPTEVAPGDDVTVISDDPCSFFEDGPSTGTIEWAVFDSDHNWDEVLAGAAPVLVGSEELDEDGNWEVVFSAPNIDDPAEGGWIPDGVIIDEVYGGLGFTVVDDEEEDSHDFVFKAICQPDFPEDEETTTTTVPGVTTPPPAVPVVDEPPFTG